MSEVVKLRSALADRQAHLQHAERQLAEAQEAKRLVMHELVAAEIQELVAAGWEHPDADSPRVRFAQGSYVGYAWWFYNDRYPNAGYYAWAVCFGFDDLIVAGGPGPGSPPYAYATLGEAAAAAREELSAISETSPRRMLSGITRKEK